jgi:hypothetical protein
MDAASRQAGPDPAAAEQDRDARVIRSCSRCWPALSIVPKAPAGGTDEAMYPAGTSAT